MTMIIRNRDTDPCQNIVSVTFNYHSGQMSPPNDHQESSFNNNFHSFDYYYNDVRMFSSSQNIVINLFHIRFRKTRYYVSPLTNSLI